MPRTTTFAKLGDLCSFKTGKLDSNAAKPNGMYPFFTCSQETFKTDTFSFDTEAVLLGGNNANGIYPLKYFKGKFDAYQRTYIIRALDENILLNRFLYYVLRLKLDLLKSISTGVATKFLTLTILKDLSIYLPKITVQNKIASILSAYDDLIENNNRCIKILEEMAQTIYNEWFVKFRFPGHIKVKMVDSEPGKMPEGWEIKNIMDSQHWDFIDENIDIYQGKKEYFATANIDGTRIVEVGEWVSYEEKPSRAQKEPIVYSVWFARMKDTYKVLGFTRANEAIAKQSILSSGFAGFKTEHNCFPFLYFLISSDKFHEIKNQFCTGATQMAITNDGISRIKVLMPDRELIYKYSEITLPMVDQIFTLQLKNKVLQRTRDLLLPKLISGEIDVEHLDIKSEDTE